jgi:hypothetical protein
LRVLSIEKKKNFQHPIRSLLNRTEETVLKPVKNGTDLPETFLGLGETSAKLGRPRMISGL